MLAQIGLPELIIILMITVTWAIPIAFAVWVVVSLRRIRAGQQAAQMKLESIERLLERS
jgi:hypothetical protein